MENKIGKKWDSPCAPKPEARDKVETNKGPVGERPGKVERQEVSENPVLIASPGYKKSFPLPIEA